MKPPSGKSSSCTSTGRSARRPRSAPCHVARKVFEGDVAVQNRLVTPMLSHSRSGAIPISASNGAMRGASAPPARYATPPGRKVKVVAFVPPNGKEKFTGVTCVQREKLPSARQSSHTTALVGGSKVNVSFVPTPTSAMPEATRASVIVRG